MQIILLIPILIGMILLGRLIGAWMFRINEIINLQKETNNILREIRFDLKEKKELENNLEEENSK
ncbi:MAG: hypothetical protein MR673_04305 [Fusobacterium perfoetens]|uniref:hypothetical protein n=1 Tax=Fusobacterium perfoetens TaxID=852 RepID=UPI0023F0E699|nr:hypothetical protein [Fusobacterium perfoetens]MCI6152335.1 hypothetical protein [Fusobacterium perfoetens]MDY3238193.1 hypothetical protein [Fusobacterium perfoetens]